MKTHIVTLETHYDCHCEACRFAKANTLTRFALWLWRWLQFLGLASLCIAAVALAVFMVIWGGERLFHTALIFKR